jgi:serine/threonine protein phosphatase PrpC
VLWAAAGASHVGRVRTVNEDAWLARPELALLAVADGMGGHARGDLASRTVVEELALVPPAASLGELEAAARAALERAQARIRGLARAEAQTVGTTVAVLLARGRSAVLLWAGDSRVYGLRGGRLEPLTRDHSLVQELVERGELTAEAARRHPWRNRITRAVGTAQGLELERRAVELAPGERVLLCSDGLTCHLEDAEIGPALARYGLGAPAALVEATLVRGARDNVTVVVGECLADDPERTRPGRG